MNKTKLCPICNQRFINQGLKNHIINEAKSEVFKTIRIMFESKEFEKNSFSKIIKKNLHFDYYMKKVKVLPNNDFTLSYTKI